MKLPDEIVYLILYKYKGFISPTAMIMKDFIENETLINNQFFPINNFYEHLKDLFFFRKINLPKFRVWLFNDDNVESDEELDYFSY